MCRNVLQAPTSRPASLPEQSSADLPYDPPRAAGRLFPKPEGRGIMIDTLAFDYNTVLPGVDYTDTLCPTWDSARLDIRRDEDA